METREAYATLWYRPTAGRSDAAVSFRGLQVLASSLRSFDARRPFVLLTDSASAADAKVQATAHTWRLQVVQVALLAGTGMLCSQTANTRLAASFTTFAAWQRNTNQK